MVIGLKQSAMVGVEIGVGSLLFLCGWSASARYEDRGCVVVSAARAADTSVKVQLR